MQTSIANFAASATALAASLFYVGSRGLRIGRVLEIDRGYLKVGKWEAYTQRVITQAGDKWVSIERDADGITPTHYIKVGRWEMTLNRAVTSR